MEKQKKLAILNLTGEFSKELGKYFSERDILVVDPLVSNEELDWTHIITRDIHDFSLINKTYDLTHKDRKVISLSKLNDLQNFVLNNGNLILDDIWFRMGIGHFILDKYFQGYGGINLSDNYPSFKEVGSFIITNPFNMGESLDRLVHSAFEQEASALSVKSYFDHVIMYVTGLKKMGKAGLPFEVTYGTYDQIFGVQIHFFCKTLDLFDVSASLTSSVSKNIEEYALNVAVQSADFFDFSYMPEVSKVIITALWTKDERIKFENRGMMLTSLLDGMTLTQYRPEDVTSNFASMKDIKDNTDKVIVPGSLPDDVLEKTTIKGLTLNKETVELVKGGVDTSDEPRLLSGDKELEDFVNIVKGKFEDDKSIIRASGNKLDLEQTVQRIAATIDESARDSDLKIRALSEKINDSIKTGLLDFAKGRSKAVEDLSDLDLDQFQLLSLPGIIKDGIINEIHESDVTSLITGQETSDEPQLIKGLNELDQLISVVKGRFEDDKDFIRLSSQKLDIDKTAFRIAATIDESTAESNLKVRSLGNKLPETIKTGLFDFAKGLNKPVEDLSNTDLDLFQDQKLPSIIKEGLLTQKLQSTELPVSDEVSPIAKILEGKLMKASIEMEQLKKENKNLLSEVRILKDSRNQMAEVQRKSVTDPSGQSLQHVPDQDDELRKHFQQKLAEQKTLNEQELQKLAGLLERETKLISDIKNEEMKSKRLQIETLQKETFFNQEIEKTQRQSKAKDLIIIKSKETFTKLLDKKERDIGDLKAKLEQLSKAIASGGGQNQAIMVKELERQNQNLGKQIEVYRSKISSIAANIQAKKDDGVSKDEVRKLQMINNQIKNQVEHTKKEMLRLVEKSNQDSSLIKSLKQEKSKLEQLVKAVSENAMSNMEAKAAPIPIAQNDQELKRVQAEAQILETQLRDANLKISALEANLKEALRSQKQNSGGEDGSKVKLAQLENSLKKLTQDLVENRNQLAESKKDTNKLRQEKTALQNQLDKMKKESDKAKAAAPKKPNGKAA